LIEKEMVLISLKLMGYLFCSESIITPDGMSIMYACSNDETKNNFLNQDEAKAIS